MKCLLPGCLHLRVLCSSYLTVPAVTMCLAFQKKKPLACVMCLLIKKKQIVKLCFVVVEVFIWQPYYSFLGMGSNCWCLRMCACTLHYDLLGGNTSGDKCFCFQSLLAQIFSVVNIIHPLPVLCQTLSSLDLFDCLIHESNKVSSSQGITTLDFFMF